MKTMRKVNRIRKISIAGMMVVAALTLVAGSAYADVIFVDATTANTVEASNPANDYNNTSWNFRSDFGSSLGDGGVIEGMDSNPELKTTISGLAEETYDIYVFYIAHTGDTHNNWLIRAGLSSDPGANTIYDEEGNTFGEETATAGANASGLTFSGGDPVATNPDTTYRPYYAVIGQATVAAGGSVDVYIDDLPPGSTSANRTWYEGVGYEVIPEPASLGLFGIACGALWFVRRKFRGIAS